jgi:hypothetical protein
LDNEGSRSATSEASVALATSVATSVALAVALALCFSLFVGGESEIEDVEGDEDVELSDVEGDEDVELSDVELSDDEGDEAIAAVELSLTTGGFGSRNEPSPSRWTPFTVS